MSPDFWPPQKRNASKKSVHVCAISSLKGCIKMPRVAFKHSSLVNKIACQPLWSRALECSHEAYHFGFDIVELTNKNSSKFKIPDWLTNIMLCSFFSVREEYFHTRDFFFSLKIEIKRQLLLFDRKFMTAEGLCW